MLLNPHTKLLIQGITGKEGQRALQWIMQARQTDTIAVVAGVTPGKGGQVVEISVNQTTLRIPVYNTVTEAIQNHPDITATSLYVPPKFVFSAASEAIAQGISLIHIFAEGVPTLDTCRLLELAQAKNQITNDTHTQLATPTKQTQHNAKQPIRIIGPSSIGFAQPDLGVVGSMGGGSVDGYLKPSKHPSKKGVAVIAKSGGMANTIANMLSNAGIAISLVIGIGGDRFIGTTYADLLEVIQQDETTTAMVIIGEIGGAYEEQLAVALEQYPVQNQKPVIGYISGIFAETLPQGVAFGHAGAIVSKTEGTRAGKIAALKQAGAHIVESPNEIVTKLLDVIK